MDQIAQFLKPDKIYANQMKRELDAKKLATLFDSLFFVFTKVPEESSKTSLIAKKYLLPL